MTLAANILISGLSSGGGDGGLGGDHVPEPKVDVDGLD
jgi:hypothetical protein